jgi:ADP-dependent NAD(P)H-hydrate dehydratase
VTAGRPRPVSPALLRRMPLPAPDADDDKEGRGRVLVVGGALEVPGALILAGVAALRAGAGKLQLATCESIAPHVGVAVPEAMVVRLPESAEGGIAADAAELVAGYAAKVAGLLVGPGMMDEQAVDGLLAALLPRLAASADAEHPVPLVVLDAAALLPLRRRPDALHHLHGRVVLTPHAGEAASMLDVDKASIEADPLAVALDAAARLQAVVALKGADTYIASPDGAAFRYSAGGVGLATSGSGDTLAGLVVGLAARGADPLTAALWAVALHGGAGRALVRQHGSIGFLARELLDRVPSVMRRLG